MKNRVKVNYYDSFRCTADQCPYTCCQEWEITIDEKTHQKWKDVRMDAIGLGDENQPDRTLCDCLSEGDTGHIMTLGEDKKCPFLNENQLCSVVLKMGEAYISEICMKYPRNVNEFEDRVEYSLDFGCPAVIDLVNNNEGGISFVADEQPACEHSLLELVREMILEIIQNKNYSLTERMMVICHGLLELRDEEELTKEVIDVYKDRESLDSLVSELRGLEFETMDSFWERNELFQDIIQFYCKEESYDAYVGEIAMWAERLEEWYSDNDLLEKYQAFETKYSAYEKLMNNYLEAEVWASCLTLESTLEDVIMVFQWIVLEYCSMKQGIFLKWLSQDEEEIGYNMVRDYIMIISRMAGYDQSDIKNCLLHSFDSTILEWGYIALVLGNGKM